MSISISGSNLITGFNNTVLAPPYGSLSFNGVNQSVVTSGTGSGANGTILDLTTGSPSWTIECWLYASEHARDGTPQYFLGKGNGQNVLFSVKSGDNTVATINTNVLEVQFYSTTVGWTYMSSWPSGTISLNTWYHVALCKDTTDGNRYYLYINGVLVSSTPNIASPAANNGQPFEIGFCPSYITADPSYALYGLLSNIRIVKGVSLYVPPDVTVPTPPLASTQSLNVSAYTQAITGTQTSLLLTTPNNASYLTDTSSYAQTVTAVNGPTSSALGPSTYIGSILFNGTNQYLTIARATQFNYSTNDFTWEMWIYPTSATWTSGTFYLMDHGPSASANQGTLVYYNNGLRYVNYYNSYGYPPATAGINYPSLFTIGGGPITANTWTHVAVCRQNLVTNMFINGKLVSSGPDPYNFATQSGAPFTSPIVSPASQSVYIGIGSNGAGPFKGNISNVRIVNGVSVYNVGNFTPPVQPLPAVQVSNNIGSPSKSINSNQTSLLVSTPYNSNFLTDGSFNGVTLTQQTVGQYPSSTYTLTSNSANPFNSNGSIFTPGSIFFNGSSQYLSIPSNANLNFSTGDFTVEAWINTTAANAGDFFIISSTGTGGFFFGYNPVAAQYGWGRTAVDWDGYSGFTRTDNVWQHIAISRQGTSIRMFLNGVQSVAAQTNSTAYDLSLTSTVVGWQSGGYYFPGYMSNVRVVKGTAVYTQNFIPTSGPFTNNQTFNQSGIPSCPVQSSQTSLLLTTPSNSSYLTDSSNNAFTVTNVGTATSTPFNPFTGNYTILANPGSVLFNGSSQYLTVTGSTTAFDMGTGSFTIEGWVYLTAYPAGGIANGGLFGTAGGSPATSGYYFNLGQDINSLRVTSNASGSWQDDLTVGTGDGVPLNAWTHLAMVKNGDNLTIYKNGINVATRSGVSSYNYSNQYAPIPNEGYVGYSNDGAGTIRYVQGYISNLRVVKGVAVYTANFVPPAGPLNNSQVENQSGAPSATVTISQTSLLLNTAFGTNFLVDGSINNLTVTNVGTATSATLDPFVF